MCQKLSTPSVKKDGLRCPYCGKKHAEWVIGAVHFTCTNTHCRKNFTIGSIDKLEGVIEHGVHKL